MQGRIKIDQEEREVKIVLKGREIKLLKKGKIDNERGKTGE